MSEYEDIVLTALIFIFCAAILIAIQFIPSKQDDTPQDTIRATPAEYQADPPMLEMKDAWISNDTANLDEIDDAFEEFVICVNAEAGNQPDDGVRAVACVLIKRAKGKLKNMHKVISAPYQFSSYSDGGMQKWNNPPERIWQICKEEFENPSFTNLYYFRTGHYSEYGNPAMKIGDHYFSTK